MEKLLTDRKPLAADPQQHNLRGDRGRGTERTQTQAP